jgi:hypothetical protein
MLRSLDLHLSRSGLIAFALWTFCAALCCPPAQAQEPSAEEAEDGPGRRTMELYNVWQQTADPLAKRKLSEDLANAAVLSQQPEIVSEIATGGHFQEKQINISQGSQPILLRERLRLQPPDDNDPRVGEPFRWVIRRMTADRIEVWLPDHGWLFDGQGQLLNEASPPRRDGVGREWYGAFLPDGSWVTTDLWAQDKVLTFFSPEGKWLKEIDAADLVPHKEGDDGEGDAAISTIGWCRCDAVGDGFVVSVGQGAGRGVAWVNAKGEHHLLEDRAAPWKLCYPRDLERKGMYTHLYIPSDRGNEWFERNEDGHGPFVGFPTLTASNFKAMIPDGDTFGFWPGSLSLWIGTKRITWVAPADGGEEVSHSVEQTLFYDANGGFTGSIAARRLTDTPALDGMMFCDGADRVISLGRDRSIQKIEQFTWSDGSVASPYKLFSELQLGFFTREKNLVLARW